MQLDVDKKRVVFFFWGGGGGGIKDKEYSNPLLLGGSPNFMIILVISRVIA